MLEAGAMAALSTAAAVGALALGAHFYEAWTAPQEFPSVSPAANSEPIAAEAVPDVEDDALTISFETARETLPVVFTSIAETDATAKSAADDLLITTSTGLAPPEILDAPEPAALETAEASEGSPDAEILAFRDDLLVLNPQRAFADQQIFGSQRPRVAPASTSDRLRAAAEDMVGEWRAPRRGDREISLFLASNDTSVSWSLSDQSANRGNVVYREDRVEMGEIVAGVAFQTEDTALALGYVQQEIPTRFGDQEESFAGMVFTITR